MHFALGRIGNLDDAQADRQIKQALDEAEAQLARHDGWPECRSRLEALLAHDEMRPFFRCQGASVYTEKEIVNADGLMKRCDRLVVREGEVWVIDFKSSVDEQERDREQVLTYKAILKTLYPQCTIRGFLVYFDEIRAVEL